MRPRRENVVHDRKKDAERFIRESCRHDFPTRDDGAAEKHVRVECADHETVPHRLGPSMIDAVSSPWLKFIPNSVSVVNIAVAAFGGLNSVRTGESKVSVFSIFVSVPTTPPTTTVS